jgi:hypothetical protein
LRILRLFAANPFLRSALSSNVPAQARRAKGDQIDPKGSTGVALQRACSGRLSCNTDAPRVPNY